MTFDSRRPIPRKDALTPVEQLRELSSFKNLKRKFAGEPKFKAGLDPNDLTVGDLVDITKLYLEGAESRSQDQNQIGAIGELVGKVLVISPEDPTGRTVTQELERLKRIGGLRGPKYEDLDRASSLYDLRPSLKKMLVAQGSPTRTIELSHYPGGIVIMQKLGDSPDKFEIFLTNRHDSDNGKPITEIFEETGLPVRGNIR